MTDIPAVAVWDHLALAWPWPLDDIDEVKHELTLPIDGIDTVLRPVLAHMAALARTLEAHIEQAEFKHFLRPVELPFDKRAPGLSVLTHELLLEVPEGEEWAPPTRWLVAFFESQEEAATAVAALN